MRSKIYVVIAGVIVMAAFCSLVLADTAKVILKENIIREYCRFYAPVKTKVYYEDVVEVISRDGDWLSVRYDGVEGCMHKSAVENIVRLRPVLLDSEIEPGSDDEVALAGKAFNPEFEMEYRNSHTEMNYALVDDIESYPVAPRQLADFIEEGGLNLP